MESDILTRQMRAVLKNDPMGFDSLDDNSIIKYAARCEDRYNKFCSDKNAKAVILLFYPRGIQ